MEQSYLSELIAIFNDPLKKQAQFNRQSKMLITLSVVVLIFSIFSIDLFGFQYWQIITSTISGIYIGVGCVHLKSSQNVLMMTKYLVIDTEKVENRLNEIQHIKLTNKDEW